MTTDFVKVQKLNGFGKIFFHFFQQKMAQNLPTKIVIKMGVTEPWF